MSKLDVIKTLLLQQHSYQLKEDFSLNRELSPLFIISSYLSLSVVQVVKMFKYFVLFLVIAVVYSTVTTHESKEKVCAVISCLSIKNLDQLKTWII